MEFEFAGPGRLIFGVGTIRQAGELATKLGRRALVVTGRNIQRSMPLIDSLELARLTHVPISTPPEPDIDDLRDALEQARVYGPDLVIGFGGGSVIDMAKAIAALLANKGDPLDYAEVIGKGKPLAKKSLPCIAIPTTAGTGSEATRNAVFAAIGGSRPVKVSLRSPSMLPVLAIVDPGLAIDLPPRLTADSGLDAITQLIEPLVSSRSNPLVDGLCREGLKRGIPALPRAFRDGKDIEARSDMAFAALAGGMALANAGLGAVHGIAGPLGGLSGAPHGAICAALLPHVVAANVRRLTAMVAGATPGDVAWTLARDASVAKYAEVASLVAGKRAGAEDAAPILAAFTKSLGARKLRDLGLARDDFAQLVEASKRANSMKANPVELSDEDILGILVAAW
ncbi:MAG TPA: iron-containing alcohol dehydrogenase [Rectinemataceae bacterium]|nr:iron-containing alcohol dehydrogenase [Rectinemataceae bacterium]